MFVFVGAKITHKAETWMTDLRVGFVYVTAEGWNKTMLRWSSFAQSTD